MASTSGYMYVQCDISQIRVGSLSGEATLRFCIISGYGSAFEGRSLVFEGKFFPSTVDYMSSLRAFLSWGGKQKAAKVIPLCKMADGWIFYITIVSDGGDFLPVYILKQYFMFPEDANRKPQELFPFIKWQKGQVFLYQSSLSWR